MYFSDYIFLFQLYRTFLSLMSTAKGLVNISWFFIRIFYLIQLSFFFNEPGHEASAAALFFHCQYPVFCSNYACLSYMCFVDLDHLVDCLIWIMYMFRLDFNQKKCRVIFAITNPLSKLNWTKKISTWSKETATSVVHIIFYSCSPKVSW